MHVAMILTVSGQQKNNRLPATTLAQQKYLLELAIFRKPDRPRRAQLVSHHHQTADRHTVLDVNDRRWTATFAVLTAQLAAQAHDSLPTDLLLTCAALL